MRTKPLMLLVAAVSMVALLSPVTVTAEPATPDVSGRSDGFGSVDIEAHVPGSSGKTTAPKPGKPTKKVTVQPVCESFETGLEAGACAVYQCPDGEQRYVRIIEELETGVKEFEHFCGLPDRDPGTLAVAEFYSKKLTVSAPTIAPETTTFANFPNIFWSDVVAYEEGTGITVADVRLKFLPVSYVWNFGDGENMKTTDPGKPRDRELTKYIQDIEKNYDITHRYQKLGTFDVTLTVVFNGQYSVNGGGWVDIAGSLSATSPPHPLRVREARGELVAPEGN